MAEKIYPASKPPQTTAPPPSFPPTKPLTRPVYRPNPRRNRRSCCCSICLILTVTVTILIFILAIAAAISYVIYRPHRPTFSISSLHVTSFNMTSSNKLNTKFSLTLTARNPNKRIVYVMDHADVTLSSKKLHLGDGKVAPFTMGKKNTTTLRTVVTSSGDEVVDDDDVLKGEIKSRKSVEVKIEVETKIRAKIGGVKTKKVPVRVSCDGVKASATGASVSGAKCKVDLRIKIWKWTI
ncbi:late embryogenesis abundant (LEA) hydroxyproline-rich glycoprotein family [Artemisia annua]|uniref:Late embryogenesis abundant (LEA) hydroxyproline-rich glycoprotein family n=1 Tax=Artemisia annua TaxID=35608 RepID=A0A2U1P5A4_ARTAN|nr:late embryogenesis abundant (LEA) hydroxyproline-rich glycoprotein family [Artemisia annua]